MLMTADTSEEELLQFGGPDRTTKDERIQVSEEEETPRSDMVQQGGAKSEEADE